MRIGFTGTRHDLTGAQRDALARVLDELAPTQADEAHHGDCPGADVEFFHAATSRGLWTVAHPSDHPLRAYTASRTVLPVKKPMDRNRDIVGICDVLIACPQGMEKMRSGTWATVRFARKIRRPHIIVWANGAVDYQKGEE